MTFAAAFYKGTQQGVAGLYNRVVRAYEDGPYSHCAMLFSDGISAHASLADGGVCFRGTAYAKPAMDYGNGNWDLIALPPALEAAARRYWQEREGWSYDLRGNVRFLVPWGNRDSKVKLFCCEGLLESLGVPEAWRFGVNPAAAVCRFVGSQSELQMITGQKESPL